MDGFKSKNHYNSLLSLYKNQLTEQERNDMEDYFENDLSLSEIALNRNVSKNAVYLSIKQGQKKLDELESRLSLNAKFNRIITELEKIDSLEEINLIKKEINKVIEEIKNGI